MDKLPVNNYLLHAQVSDGIHNGYGQERNRVIILCNQHPKWATDTYPQKGLPPRYKNKNRLFKKFFSLIFFYPQPLFPSWITFREKH